MGTELRLRDLRLLVDRKDGVLLVDPTEERRSGMTTTGTAPLFHTERRAFRLERELVVVVEPQLSRGASPGLETVGS
jgi:hypothetical protein